MIQFVPLKAEHILAMGDVLDVMGQITPDLAGDLEEIGGVAAIDGHEVLVVAGVMTQWRGVGLAWCFLSRRWKKHARAISSEINRYLDNADFARIETAVRVDFERGKGWAKMLGFELETPLARKWGPDGSDYSIFVRVK